VTPRGVLSTPHPPPLPHPPIPPSPTLPHPPTPPSPTIAPHNPQERAHLSLAGIEREAINHSRLRHPHIIRFREVFFSERYFNM
jgi:hypothetical protein